MRFSAFRVHKGAESGDPHLQLSSWHNSRKLTVDDHRKLCDKRNMNRTALKYFNGTQELDRVQNMRRVQFEAMASDPTKFPTDLGDWSDAVRVGFLPRKPGEATTFEHLRPLKVLRIVKVIATKDPHVCDWRCEGAYRHSECRCSCGGRNHGIKCEPA